MRSRQSRLIPNLSIMLGLAGCASGPTQPVPPAVIRPAPPPVTIPPTAATWRDIPLTPGLWTWTNSPRNSVAQFGAANAPALFSLNCDRINRRLTIAAPMPMPKPTTTLAAPLAPQVAAVTITTTSTSTTTSITTKLDMAANQASMPRIVTQEIDVNAPLLDAIVHSQGRFMVQVEGGVSLIIPTSGESARAVEDCRI